MFKQLRMCNDKGTLSSTIVHNSNAHNHQHTSMKCKQKQTLIVPFDVEQCLSFSCFFLNWVSATTCNVSIVAYFCLRREEQLHHAKHAKLPGITAAHHKDASCGQPESKRTFAKVVWCYNTKSTHHSHEFFALKTERTNFSWCTICIASSTKTCTYVYMIVCWACVVVWTVASSGHYCLLPSLFNWHRTCSICLTSNHSVRKIQFGSVERILFAAVPSCYVVSVIQSWSMRKIIDVSSNCGHGRISQCGFLESTVDFDQLM